MLRRETARRRTMRGIRGRMAGIMIDPAGQTQRTPVGLKVPEHREIVKSALVQRRKKKLASFTLVIMIRKPSLQSNRQCQTFADTSETTLLIKTRSSSAMRLVQ